MRILLLIVALMTSALLGAASPFALAQSPDSSDKSPAAAAPDAARPSAGDSAKSESAKAGGSPEVNPAHEMLLQAYYAGGQLPVEERAAQLCRVVIIAAKIRHPMLRQWIDELFQLTAGL